MAIVLCLSFMTTTSFAEKLINGILIKTNTKEVLKAGETVKPLTFNVVDRDLQGIVDVNFIDWFRVDYNQNPPVEENIDEKTFIEGKVYQYKFKLSITNSDYKFSNNLYIEVDTEPYYVVLKDGQSEYTTSPSLPLIAGPEGPIDSDNPDSIKELISASVMEIFTMPIYFGWESIYPPYWFLNYLAVEIKNLILPEQ